MLVQIRNFKSRMVSSERVHLAAHLAKQFNHFICRYSSFARLKSMKDIIRSRWYLPVISRKKSKIQQFLILSHQETNSAKDGLIFDEIEPYFSEISGQKLV